MERFRPSFPLSPGKPRVDDRRVLSGIIFINCNGLRWRDAPAAYGPPKTLYNRFARWSRMGVFARILAELAAKEQETDTVMIDAKGRPVAMAQTAGQTSDYIGARLSLASIPTAAMTPTGSARH